VASGRLGEVVSLHARRNRLKESLPRYGRIHPVLETGIHDIDLILWYVGKPVRFAGLEQAIDYVSTVAAPFGLHTREEWREITEPSLRRDGGEWVLHYDPLIAMPFGAVTPQAAAAGEAAMWKLYDSIRCPTLITRGAESDLLSRETAEAMTRRGPHARLVEFAGVGHAPMFFHDDQIAVVRDFLLQG
jgi:pimeloyl-ACP methyl ester carboxylesterase